MKRPIGQILTDLAAAAPDRPAVTCGGETVTRAELESAANRLARAYERLGVTEGRFVTIALPNGIEFVTACFAAWKLGAVPQPVSSRLPARERDAIVELADPALVVGVDGPGNTDGPAGDEGAGRATRPTVPPGFRPDPTLSDAPIEPVRVAPTWKAPTSGGSTGRPKLIVSGQDGAIDPTMGEAYGMRADGVQLVPRPPYHNAPFSQSTLGLYLGQHLVVLERFDPHAALEAIQAHRVEWVNFVPTMMLLIWWVLEAEPGRYDLSSLRTVWHMAAPPAPPRSRRPGSAWSAATGSWSCTAAPSCRPTASSAAPSGSSTGARWAGLSSARWSCSTPMAAGSRRARSARSTCAAPPSAVARPPCWPHPPRGRAADRDGHGDDGRRHRRRSDRPDARSGRWSR
ncbi:MAG TPA: AMP-binding protein [Acidimicrobiales bacterium]